jgi:WD40 repeat protein/tetratricopeptide (TPR) repeat protein
VSDLAERYSDLCLNGQMPDLRDFLAGVADPHEVLAVVRVHQHRGWERGEGIPAESYLEWFPALAQDSEHAVELIYAEFLLREQVGAAPPLADLTRRFPAHAERLREQIELHRALTTPTANSLIALPPSGPEAPTVLPPDLDAVTAPASADAPAEAPEVPGYEIEGELGRGGMGVVYLARQVKVRRLVALKMLLHAGHASRHEQERFRIEAEAAARLQHPGIVQVYEVGVCRGYPFFSMEYAPGGTLALKLAGTPLTVEQSARLVRTLAEAVQHAHERGVVHRDLKPGNVLLALDGSPKVSDFGLAKRLDAQTFHTQSGSILGTPSYMAPEQAGGPGEDVGPAADVYALGAILYECLTGRPPFKAATPLDTVLQVLNEEPVPPAQLNPKVPRDLETICLKCLEKMAGRRYGSARALADDLTRFLDGRPIAARPVGRLQRAWRWCRRNPSWAATLASVVLLLLALAGGAGVSAVWLKQERDTARDNARQARENLDVARENLRRAEKAELESRRRTFAAYLDQARASRYSRRPGQRFRTLQAIRAAARLAVRLDLPPAEVEKQREELRNLAITALALPDLEVLREWPGYPPGTVSLDVDPELRRYVWADGKGAVVVRRLADDRELARWPSDGKPFSAAFSPCGGFVILRRGPGEVRCWRPGEKRAFVRINEPGLVKLVRPNPAGSALAVAREDGVVNLYSLPGGRRTCALRVRGWQHWNDHPVLEFAPDGRTLAVVGGRYIDPERRVVRLFDVPTGADRGSLAHPDKVLTAQWHPDGRTLFTGGIDTNEVRVWDVATRKVVEVNTRQKGGAAQVGINCTGDVLAGTSGWWGGSKFWHAVSGQELLRTSTQHQGFVRSTPDGRLFRLLVNAPKVAVEQFLPAHEYRVLVRKRGARRDRKIGLPSIHPNGRLLAAGHEDGVVLWDLESGWEVGFLPVGSTESVLFEPSGSLLTYGAQGLQRWPVQAALARPHQFRVGPPRLLLRLASFDLRVAVSRDGRVVAAATRDGAVVWRADHPGVLLLRPHEDARRVAVSPDGRWVATAAHFTRGLRVWDTRSGKEVVHLAPKDSFGTVNFTPDGKHLVAGPLWFEVGSWKPARAVAGWELGAISPDGRLLACGAGEVIRLFARSGRRLAELHHPDQGRPTFLTFDPAGRRLVAADLDTHVLHVWDLGAVRTGLASVGLDWDAPAIPPKKGKKTLPIELAINRNATQGARAFWQDQAALYSAAVLLAPLSPEAVFRRGQAFLMLGRWADAVRDFDRATLLYPRHVEAYHLRAHAHEKQGKWDRALADTERAVALRPGDFHFHAMRGQYHFRLGHLDPAIRDLERSLGLAANQPDMRRLLALACNNRAWQHATGAGKERDPARAVRLARRAVQLAPGTATVQNTLGVALYRAGQYKEAVVALRASLKAGADASLATDLFFLAMCRHRLGDKAGAKGDYDRAVRWCKDHPKVPPVQARELAAFQKEARGVLEGKGE